MNSQNQYGRLFMKVSRPEEFSFKICFIAPISIPNSEFIQPNTKISNLHRKAENSTKPTAKSQHKQTIIPNIDSQI